MQKYLRFMVFGNFDSTDCVGLGGVLKSFNSLEEAKSYVEEEYPQDPKHRQNETLDILDREEGAVVARYEIVSGWSK